MLLGAPAAASPAPLMMMDSPMPFRQQAVFRVRGGSRLAGLRRGSARPAYRTGAAHQPVAHLERQAWYGPAERPQSIRCNIEIRGLLCPQACLCHAPKLRLCAHMPHYTRVQRQQPHGLPPTHAHMLRPPCARRNAAAPLSPSP
jgi:hypothetical protein